jgi:hypothetical protein
MLLSLGIAVAVIVGVALALAGGSGFDLRAHAKRPPTEGEIKKALRAKKNNYDCTRSGGRWMLVGNKNNGNGVCTEPAPSKAPKPTTAATLQAVDGSGQTPTTPKPTVPSIMVPYLQEDK